VEHGVVLMTVNGHAKPSKDEDDKVQAKFTVNGKPAIDNDWGTFQTSGLHDYKYGPGWGYSMLAKAPPGRVKVAVDIEATHETQIEGGAVQAGVMPAATLLPRARNDGANVGGSKHPHVGHTGTPSHMGCFHLADGELSQHYSKAAWNVTTCAKHCGVRGLPYAALRTPEDCRCGTNFGSAGAATHGQCDRFCAETADFCGTSSADLKVASVFESTMPMLPSSRSSVGCLAVGAESTDFDSEMVGIDLHNGAVNIGNCIVSCAAKRYAYAALTKKRETVNGKITVSDACYCSHAVGGKDRMSTPGKCNSPCIGDTTQLCGDYGFLNVFETGVNTDVIVVAVSEVEVTKTSVLLVEANGLMSEGDRQQQSMSMHFSLQNDQTATPMGAFKVQGTNTGDAWSHFSTIGMRAVKKGIHELSLTASALGSESLYDFSRVDGYSCHGAFYTTVQTTIAKCSQLCRDSLKCKAFTQKVSGDKACSLYLNADACTTKKEGHVTGIRMVRSKVCGTTEEGSHISMVCPQKHQVISAVHYATFGYIAPKVLFKRPKALLSSPDLRAVNEFAKVDGAFEVPGDFNGDGKQDIAIFGGGDENNVPIIFSNGDGSFHTEMLQVPKSLTAKRLRPKHILVGQFTDSDADSIAVVGNGDGTPMTLVTANGKEKITAMTDQALDSPAVLEFLAWSATGEARTLVGDLDGNGKDDLVVIGVPYDMMGCYWEKEKSERVVDVFAAKYTGGAMPLLCVEACRDKNMAYAALQGDNCYCGNKIPTFGKSKLGCSYVCSGKKDEACGGKHAVSLFGTMDWKIPVAFSPPEADSDADGFNVVAKDVVKAEEDQKFLTEAVSVTSGMPGLHLANADFNGDGLMDIAIVGTEFKGLVRVQNSEHCMVPVISKGSNSAKSGAALSVSSCKDAENGLGVFFMNDNGILLHQDSNLCIMKKSDSNAAELSDNCGGSAKFAFAWSVNKLGVMRLAGSDECLSVEKTKVILGKCQETNGVPNEALWTLEQQSFDKAIRIAYADGEGGWDISASNLTGTVGDVFSEAAAKQGSRVLSGDYDGDDIYDLLLLPSEGEKIMVAFSQGNGLWKITEEKNPVLMQHANSIHARVSISDFNGDGIDDISLVAPNIKQHSGAHHVALSVGDGTFKVSSFTKNAKEYPFPMSVFTGDHNDDGKNDIVLLSPGSSKLPVYISSCLEKMPKPEEARCKSLNAMSYVRHECVGQERCQVKASRELLGDACPTETKKRTLMVQAVCSTPSERARPYKLESVVMSSALLPDAKLYSVVPKVEPTVLAGDDSSFSVVGPYKLTGLKALKQSLLVMTAHGYLKGSPSSASVDFAFFVDGKPAVNGDGAAGRWGLHKVWGGASERDKTPIVFKQMAIVQPGEHQTELRFERSGGTFTVHDLNVQVAMVPLAEGDPQFALYHELAGKARFDLALDDGSVSSVRDIPVPTHGEWFHLAATYDTFMLKVYVDGVEKANKVATAQGVAPSDPSESLFVGKSCAISDPSPQRGIVGDIDNVRVWTEQRNGMEIRRGMHAMVDGKTPGLAAQWMMSQGLTKQSMASLTGSSTKDRQLTLYGKHRLRKSVVVGPFIWEICPGASAKPRPAICTLNGECKIGSRTSATCKCDRGFFGRACEVGCPNARGPGGPCHENYNWGKCVFDAVAYKAECECKHGYLGDACQYPCPGLDKVYKKTIGRACDGRGTCFVPEPITIPKTIEEANTLAAATLEPEGTINKQEKCCAVKGKKEHGKAKICETVPCKGTKGIGAVTVNQDHKLHKGAYDWKRFTGLAGYLKTEKDLTTLQTTISNYDHHAQCGCNDPMLVHGEACHVLCPAKNNRICSARGLPAKRHDPWYGEQLYSDSTKTWYGAKDGCQWELAQTLLNHYSNKNPTTWYADTPGVPHGLTPGHAGRSPRGVVSLCRCNKEVGYHAHNENCVVECPGANWMASDANVCGGKYKWVGSGSKWPETGPYPQYRIHGSYPNDDPNKERGICQKIAQHFGMNEKDANAGLCQMYTQWKCHERKPNGTATVPCTKGTTSCSSGHKSGHVKHSMCKDSPVTYKPALAGDYLGKKPVRVCDVKWRALQIPVWSGLQISATADPPKHSEQHSDAKHTSAQSNKATGIAELKATEIAEHKVTGTAEYKATGTTEHKATGVAESIDSVIPENNSKQQLKSHDEGTLLEEHGTSSEEEESSSRKLLAQTKVGFWRRRRRRRRYIVRYVTNFIPYCQYRVEYRKHRYAFSEEFTFRRSHGRCMQQRYYTKAEESRDQRSVLHRNKPERVLEQTAIEVCNNHGCKSTNPNCYRPPPPPSFLEATVGPIIADQATPALSMEAGVEMATTALKTEVKPLPQQESTDNKQRQVNPLPKEPKHYKHEVSIEKQPTMDELEKLKKELAASEAQKKAAQAKVTTLKRELAISEHPKEESLYQQQTALYNEVLMQVNDKYGAEKRILAPTDHDSTMGQPEVI
jgi:hypothetical protein